MNSHFFGRQISHTPLSLFDKLYSSAEGLSEGSLIMVA